MANVTPQSFVRQIGSLFEGAAVIGLSDRQLLDRFTAQHDSAGEAAFAALVARHGPMVLRVCNQLLGDQHHSEDAFQAVFLVLARRARSIRDPDLLGNWLYGIALRTARKSRARLARQHRNEKHRAMSQPEASTTVTAEQVAIALEHAETLHSEIEQLPRVFRVPVVLCYFEGLTLDQAALRLRCPAGTIHSRLARAREKLRRGLTRRGIILPAASLAAALSPGSAPASVSSHLCETTARAAFSFAVGQSSAPLAADLAREVLRSMMLHKFKLVSLTLFFVGAVATSTGYLTLALARTDEPKSRAAIPQPPAVAKPDDTNAKPAPGRMFVVGRVLDPQGKPVPGATVMASARPKFLRPGAGDEGRYATAIAHANGDESGRFRLDTPRTSSSRSDEFTVVALAPGYGTGWVNVDPDADQPAGDISLEPEQLIHGRLLDLTGRPAQGVVVSVVGIQRVLVPDSNPQLDGRITSEGPIFWWARVNDIPGWPKPATTDADGRFTVHGVGRGLEVRLNVVAPRFAPQMIELATDDAPGAKAVSSSLQPAQIITGRVTLADSGRPVPHARVEIVSTGEGQRGSRSASFTTDADGRFRANPWPGNLFFVTASPPLGQLCLANRKRIDWPKGAIEQSIDLVLPKGVVIRGKVTEEGSGRPVAGASVHFKPHTRADGGAYQSDGQSETGADGSFELAAPPVAGHLAVLAPTEDFVLREIGNREFFSGQPGGMRLYSHSFVACEPQPGGLALEVRVTLRRGITVVGRFVGPDGNAVKDVWIIGPEILGQGAPAWRRWQINYHGNAVGGRFELHGRDPDRVLPVYFLDPKRRLGATAQLSGKSAADGPLTIRLEPCGAATARLLDAHGRPVAGYRNKYMVSMIIIPDRDPGSRAPGTRTASAARRVGCSRSIPSITRKSPCPTPRAASHSRL